MTAAVPPITAEEMAPPNFPKLALNGVANLAKAAEKKPGPNLPPRKTSAVPPMAPWAAMRPIGPKS
jgi:hypothetical protein